MLNPALEALTDYPFDRLRALLDPIAPPTALKPLVLSVGEPRHAPPAMVREIIDREHAAWNRYPPVDGTEAFRQAVAQWLTNRFQLQHGFIDPAQHILPVAGTREALFLIANVCVPPAVASAPPPAVLMPNPFYQVYLAAAALHGAEPVFLPATREIGFLPDLTSLPEALLARTAMLYLCSPANPQGAAADPAYLEAAVRLARRHGFTLVVDECYAEIYDAAPPAGVLAACAALGEGLENVLAFHSLSKRSSVPGLRSGFVAGDPRLIAAFRRLRAFAGATLPLPVLAASTALWQDAAHVEENRRLYRAKFDLAERLLGGRFAFYRPAGGFFLWLDVEDGETAARTLWQQAALRVLPGAYLARSDATGDNPGRRYIRMALIDDLAATEDALRRLKDAL
ncbi:putative aminotransferase [uncultured Defluviicoccus sp.]|uniref:Putative aminotransferase n=1 Tax=metagenome TaxID=256318 RepID=A0A380TAT5_9ZZZZ|nr:putative aminotransferase [uncultured Defluviicoccus sp.]